MNNLFKSNKNVGVICHKIVPNWFKIIKIKIIDKYFLYEWRLKKLSLYFSKKLAFFQFLALCFDNIYTLIFKIASLENCLLENL